MRLFRLSAASLNKIIIKLILPCTSEFTYIPAQRAHYEALLSSVRRIYYAFHFRVAHVNVRLQCLIKTDTGYELDILWFDTNQVYA